MKLYQIDFKRLVLLLLPTFLRRPRLFAFLCALTFGVAELHVRFLKLRDSDLLRIRRNGQVCYLRGLLNDELDPVNRQIKIRDAADEGDWVYAMDEGEAYQLLIDGTGTMVYDETLIIANTAFIYVLVPWKKEETNLNNRLHSYLREYKLLSKKYMIRYEQARF